ncbi:hypothetical protein [Streptomyces sp. NBC_01244]|uniref:hypothetical protein n=1 Tax=Streptomyces sp. NBC_01244 TaxID=2903797 RepID=UPI002E15A34B|nr:hypothetical protein OG247_38245 [Streptomyces sp. NBC_01244]
MKSKTAARLAAGFVAALALTAASPAFALEVKYEGELVTWTEASDSILNLRDLGTSYQVKSEYYRNANPGSMLTLWNKNGPSGPADNDGNPGTVESGQYSTIFKLRGVVVRNNAPDRYTSWVTG